MINVEYRIGKYFCYVPQLNVIEIGKSSDKYSKLNDEELSLVISDSLTHEFIHVLLHKEFNITVSKLFDTIGHLFYTDYRLFERLNLNSEDSSWKNFIETHDIQEFYDQYMITDLDIILANNVCSEVNHEHTNSL